MPQRRAKMLLRSVFIVLVLSVVAESCDLETGYIKDNKCCKKCGPGKRMIQNSACEDPVCQDCADGEFQDAYTTKSQCKRQPTCDRHLNLQTPTQSKTELSQCVCFPDHHCTNTECVSCVRNTVCQAGEKVRSTGTQMSDTVCEPCPNGTFSNRDSALTCMPWTECSLESKEVAPGSATSDRICEVQNQKFRALVTTVVIIVLLVLMGVVAYFIFCRKGKTGSVTFAQKLLPCAFWDNKYTPPPPQENAALDVENGQPKPPGNQPQEDTEDLLKLEGSLSPGISENGMPVIQDHSKSLLLSETETEPESFS
uniref:Tumor necrosis factor receptor superfamily member 5 n=1 Tax=Ictalurus punctatus TaxID=7998 RepID=W5ULB2_ICTPU